jgi:UDP-2-acetamido-3-amino-2,3-dideoxy-glucuronate N-acetyltransferase
VPRASGVHPTASVDAGAAIGEGTNVWHYSHVMPGATIGPNCNLGQNVYVGRDVRVGAGVKIQNNVSVYEGVEIEDHVFCGPSVVFTNVREPRARIDRKHEIERTLVREGATLGANATILCGITVGRHAFVGAGAVVTADVPDFALVVGTPARLSGWVCVCGRRLQFTGDRTRCEECGDTYRRLGPARVEREL